MQEYGSTALIVASETGHAEVARVLVARGATVDYQDKVRHGEYLYLDALQAKL